MFLMRFDMRAPAFSSAPPAELYAAALEMAEWGEKNGCMQIVVSEHHGSEDGYLPSPLVLASAIAARTKSIPIQLAALIVPLHDPLRLAEDMAVLDILSGGRVSYVTAVGYVEAEFEMFDRSFRGRGKRMDHCLTAMHSAWTGEPFEFEGRSVRVAPKPLTPGGPALLMGGNSLQAARRAAHFDMGLLAQGLNPDIEETYRSECEKLGKPPGLCINPPPQTVTSAFVAEDVDRAWSEFGPHLLHDAQAYARWMTRGTSLTTTAAASVEELRAQQNSYQIFSVDEAVDYVKQNGLFLTHPLCGGLPPKLAWPSLELLASEVLPRTRG
ncbi:MAG: LLM class flavin-dependent oxidoreductase [Deltaproteobacteria bacterium]|nr:LLM class flavin-dependent oxidoreductase [Deltaproteobacteria bacterium]MBW2398070.1 LLM class flavin-dependent oxidoreductase [Deltaproteobacteria bacterium]MBW2665704.1 LLM class flavin-dependent oxidoreductase [Deltaproteobacteria bacterium]